MQQALKGKGLPTKGLSQNTFAPKLECKKHQKARDCRPSVETKHLRPKNYSTTNHKNLRAASISTCKVGGDVFLKIKLPVPLKARGLSQLRLACARWGRRFSLRNNLPMLSKACGYENQTAFTHPQSPQTLEGDVFSKTGSRSQQKQPPRTKQVQETAKKKTAEQTQRLFTKD